MREHGGRGEGGETEHRARQAAHTHSEPEALGGSSSASPLAEPEGPPSPARLPARTMEDSRETSPSSNSSEELSSALWLSKGMSIFLDISATGWTGSCHSTCPVPSGIGWGWERSGQRWSPELGRELPHPPKKRPPLCLSKGLPQTAA